MLGLFGSLHGGSAALGRTRCHVRADDLRAIAHCVVLLILNRDAEAGQKAIVAKIVDCWFVRCQIEGGNLGGSRFVAERRLSPSADQLAGFEIVGGRNWRRRR